MSSPYHSDWIDDRDDYRLEQVGEHEGAPVYAKVGRPVIVVLCGSTRFWEQFQEANYRETMAGKIVLSVGFYPHVHRRRVSIDGCMGPEESEVLVVSGHGQDKGCTPEQKVQLDKLHLKKIELADECLVLNVNGYIGESTRNELEYARKMGKVVRFLEPDKVPE